MRKTEREGFQEQRQRDTTFWFQFFAVIGDMWHRHFSVMAGVEEENHLESEDTYVQYEQF